MFSILFVSHGAFALAMEASAEMLQGTCEAVYKMDITSEMSIEKIEQNLFDMLRQLCAGGDVVALSDIPLGTPFNVLIRLTQKLEFSRVIHITGANLPLYLELRALCKSGAPLVAVQEAVITEARKKMFCVNDFCRSLRCAAHECEGDEENNV